MGGGSTQKSFEPLQIYADLRELGWKAAVPNISRTQMQMKTTQYIMASGEGQNWWEEYNDIGDWGGKVHKHNKTQTSKKAQVYNFEILDVSTDWFRRYMEIQ